ncbi:hypothetical protein ILUMI_05056 [Ignelater luminosus]|uniref:Major facilitator superfamily (MFS) profile domain-containing protein n=1 Tax=Ignelater luminosus TaxID=2038154 RepID=A0A8K0D7T9_IGNLU|nr:hypothetical protein ILUMI_05056 [Ignelater luminosus]
MSEYAQVSVTNNDELPEIEFKVYKIRWLMLFLYVFCCASSLMQWVQYSIIANTVVDYYNVSYTAVDWSSMIYLLVCIPFIFPACYVLDKMGIRISTLIGIGGTCLGSWIKLGSVSPERFWVVLVGQGVVGVSQIFMLGIPPKLAAVWFGSNQVSLACSIGLLGIQIGTAIGFLIPPILVDDQGDKEGVERGLYLMLIIVALVTTILLIIVITCFKERPVSPPSLAQSQIRQKREYNFKESLKELFSNHSFIFLAVSYGINLGIFLAFSTLLNQIILKHYPDSEEDAGRIGLLIIVSGMVGSLTSGIILDTFSRFRETTVVVYVSSLLSMLTFTFTLEKGIEIVYVVSAVFGFFVIALFTVGYELAAELTYPVEEGTSAGILTGVAQFFGIVFTYLYSYLLNVTGDKTANLTMCSILFVSVFLIACVRYDLKRRAIQMEARIAKLW